MFRAAAARTQVGRVIGRRNASTNVAVQNLESRWKTLSTSEQNSIAKQLEEAQKGDWKVLTSEEKKAACKFKFLFICLFISGAPQFQILNEINNQRQRTTILSTNHERHMKMTRIKFEIPLF